MTTVVHCKKEAFDVYIGRPYDSRLANEHFGNPFTHKEGTKASVILPTRDDCVTAHDEWLDGTYWRDIEPQRREWVLNNLHLLKDKVIACWCSPLSCHGDNYAKRLNK